MNLHTVKILLPFIIALQLESKRMKMERISDKGCDLSIANRKLLKHVIYIFA